MTSLPREKQSRRAAKEMQSAPPPLEDGLFVGRPSTSRLQLRPRTRSRRSHSRPGTAGIPRASSVPLLLGDHQVNLEVHSTPISLATRSLTNTAGATRVPFTAAALDERTHPKPPHDKPVQSEPVDSKAVKKSRTRPKVSVTSRRGKIAAHFNGLRSELLDAANVDRNSSGIEGGETEGRIRGEEEERENEGVVCNEVALKSEVVIPNLSGSVETERVEGETAARRIQNWYRSRQQERQRAQVRSLLREKKTELDTSRSKQLNLSLREEKEREEKRRRRQEKMAASRQAAILSLQQKREERRREEERIAQEEIALLQASGKIKRPDRERDKRRRKKEVVEDHEKESEPKSTELLGPKATPSPNKESPLREAQCGSHVTQSPVQPTPVVTTNTSTYADILDTLRLLEEAPPPLPGSKSKETLSKPYSSAVVEVGVARQIHHTHSYTVGVARESGPAQSNLSESKLHSILSYLDEVERVDEGTTCRNPTSETVKQGSGGLELETVASDVTSTILSQRMEIDNKNKTVEMLQKALNQQRELTVYHAKEMEKEGERRLDLQRQEYETTIQRHQTFIDQLIEDKKKLGEKCEKLVRELRETSSKYQTKVKTMEETHAAELAKVRQVGAATDKLRREKWRAEESRRIKEATVRSLEPEIQRIIQKGKTDIQRLKATQEAELLAADERAGRRFVAQMEELRAQCAAEKEQACAHERELARQRYEKLAEQEEMSSQQQRRRLFAELEQEREKMAAQWDLQRHQLEQQLTESQEGHTREVEELQRQHSRVMEETERRHGSQLRSLEERMTTERGAWQENYTRRQETAFLAREREMRERLRLERDKEIEMVISRLEQEAEVTRTQNEKAADARIKRIREKCEAELTEVERLERSTQEKLTSAKRELGEREGEVARIRSLLRQKEEEVRQVGEVAERLTRERDNVTDVVRQEFADRLVSTEEENRRVKMEMSELRARHKLEQERGQREKERELEEVHSRVRQALEKKEENLASLRSQHAAALRRAEHLEMLLERQRRELLKK